MAKTPGKVSEADLLADDDGDGTEHEQVDQEGQVDLDDLGDLDHTPEREGQVGLDAKADDLDVVVIDSDEGEADGDLDGQQDKGDVRLEQDTDDTGEELGDDLLSADEKKSYSVKVQKRIQRERRLKVEETQRANAEAGARRNAEGRLLEAQRMSAALLVRVLDNDIAAKSAELLKAKEDGSSADEIKLQGELDDLRAKKRDVSVQKDALDKAELPAEQPAATENPILARWMGRNRWYVNKDFSAASMFVKAIDQAMAAERKAGTFQHAPNTQEWFAELDRRLHKDMPTLKTRIQQVYGGGNGSRPGARSSTRVAPVVRTVASRAASGNRVTLNKEDLSNMVQFGLDPKNKTHLREYAMQKRGGSNAQG